MRNIRENPHVALQTIDPNNLDFWQWHCTFERTETSGPVFDQMEMQLEVIASMTGATGLFHLKAAEIFRVERVRLIELPRR